MNDEKVNGDSKEPEFQIGFDSTDPTSMIIHIPIRAWAMDLKHGTALFHGHMREAEAIGMRQIMQIRQKNAQKGVGGLTIPGMNGNGSTLVNGNSAH